MADKSLTNGLIWVVEGTFRNTPGNWELVVDQNAKRIVHLLFRGNV